MFRFARSDPVRAEAINLLTPEQIVDYLAVKYNEVYIDVAQYEKGEVLTDSKGKGSLQR